MKKLILIITGLVCAVVIVQAQSPPEINPLLIGDTLPDIRLNHIINYKDSTAKLSDFRGKLMILDFWATWCSSCVGGFPKLAALQRKFPNRVQFFLVNTKDTRDSKEKIASFFKHRRLPDGKEYNLPVIVQDTILNQLFPHTLIPHYVWINPDGSIRATTASDQVNEKNIAYLLAGKNTRLRLKEDIINFDRHKPLFYGKQVKAYEDSIRYYSILSHYIPGIPSGVFGDQDSSGLITRLCYTNLPAMQLYKMAFHINWPNNRVILEVKDSSDFKGLEGNSDDWRYRRSYCYELYTRPLTKQSAYQRMRHDLDDYLGYRAGVEKRKIKCLIVRTNKSVKKPISKGGQSANNLGMLGVLKYIHNEPISRLIDYLNQNLLLPILDETNFSKPIDMELPENVTDANALKACLEKYGFYLTESKRVMNVFVISDN